MHKTDQYPFIVLEGIDGAGTSSQTELLVKKIISEGHVAKATQEPTGMPIGSLIRKHLSGDLEKISSTTMSLLFASDRADHVSKEIVPWIQQKTVVVSDRYLASSMAYQGIDEDLHWIQLINSRIEIPSLMIFLEVDPKVAEQRRQQRDQKPEIYENSFFQEQVAEKYREVCDLLTSWTRVVTIDGNQTIDSVSDAIWREVQPFVNKLS